MNELRYAMQSIIRDISKGNLDYILNSNVIFPAIIILLIIWLIYRIKTRIRITITKEINHYFPSIRRQVDDLERRLQYMSNRAADLENKLKDIDNKTQTSQ